MSWVATAVVGGAAVGAYASDRASSRASKDSAKATEASSAASAEQLAFEQEKYDDWNAVYGPLQDNLANYYQNVSPDYYAAVGLEAFEKTYLDSVQRVEESFMQRGIDMSSGIAASIAAQQELGAAEHRAGIRREAPRQALEDQSRFLQIGLGQNPASGVSGALSQATQSAQQNAAIAQSTSAAARQQAAQATGQMVAQATTAIGRGIDMYNKPAPAPTYDATYNAAYGGYV